MLQHYKEKVIPALKEKQGYKNIMQVPKITKVVLNTGIGKAEDRKAAGMEVRGVADHQFVDSIYFRDPNGYVIELTAKRPGHDEMMDPASNGARAKLDSWQAAKS